MIQHALTKSPVTVWDATLGGVVWDCIAVDVSSSLDSKVSSFALVSMLAFNDLLHLSLFWVDLLSDKKLDGLGVVSIDLPE